MKVYSFPSGLAAMSDSAKKNPGNTVVRFLARRSLTKLVAYFAGIYRPDSQLSGAEAETLLSYAMDSRTIVEIGVSEGVTSVKINRNRPSGSSYYGVDPYFPGKLGFCATKVIARREVSRVNRENTFWIEDLGADAVERSELSGISPDLIFFDGDHSYEGLRQDWEAWSPKLGTGAIAAFHDVLCGRFGCGEYFNQEIAPSTEIEVLKRVDSMAVVRLR